MKQLTKSSAPCCKLVSYLSSVGEHVNVNEVCEK